MSDGDRRPLGHRPAGNQAIGFAVLGAFLCLGLVLVAAGWMGSDRPLTLAFIYVTAPPGAIFCFYRPSWRRGQQQDDGHDVTSVDR